MQLKETSFMNDSNSQNAKGFQNPPQQKIQRENKIRRMSYWKASESWKEPKYVQWCYGMNLDGNKGLQSSSLNYVVKQKID